MENLSIPEPSPSTYETLRQSAGAVARIEHRIAPKSDSVVDYLEREFHLDHTTAVQLIELGAVFIEKRRAAINSTIAAGNYLRIHLEPRRFDVAAFDWQRQVIADLGDLLVVAKPSGIPIHPTVDNQVDNVVTQVSRTRAETLFITHRLDRPTSGLCVLARTPQAQTRFNKLVLEHRVRKTYRCLTTEQPRLGLVTHFMMPHPRSPKILQAEPSEGWKHCQLEVLERSHLHIGWESEILLLTGRTHQIRAQLAFEKTPILGDSLYGGHAEEHFHSEKIALHSYRLAFSWAGRCQDFTLSPSWRLSPSPEIFDLSSPSLT